MKGVSLPASNLGNLTKNLTAHLAHNGCAVLPIVFTNNENNTETLEVKVNGLHFFDSFETLYDKLPLLKCGYDEQSIKTASPGDMKEYYSEEKQQKYGGVGIEIEVI